MGRLQSTAELKHARHVRDLATLAERAAALLSLAGNVHMPFPADDRDRMRCLDLADELLAKVRLVRDSGPDATGRRD